MNEKKKKERKKWGRDPDRPGEASKSSGEEGRDRSLGEVWSAGVDSAALVPQRAPSPGSNIRVR